MPVSVRFEEPARFVTEGTGKITGAECIDAFEQVLSHPRFHKGVTILAITHHVTGAPATDELRDIAAVAAALKNGGMSALAIVTAPGFTYGVARMFSALADLMGVHVEVFLDAAEARDRLDEISARAA
jgi:hypothetical protein